jgi:hypothetical protein
MRYWMCELNKPCKQARMPLRTLLTAQWNTPPDAAALVTQLSYRNWAGCKEKSGGEKNAKLKIKNEKLRATAKKQRQNQSDNGFYCGGCKQRIRPT